MTTFQLASLITFALTITAIYLSYRHLVMERERVDGLIERLHGIDCRIDSLYSRFFTVEERVSLLARQQEKTAFDTTYAIACVEELAPFADYLKAKENLKQCTEDIAFYKNRITECRKAIS